jgi:hypothetical protein
MWYNNPIGCQGCDVALDWNWTHNIYDEPGEVAPYPLSPYCRDGTPQKSEENKKKVREKDCGGPGQSSKSD